MSVTSGADMAVILFVCRDERSDFVVVRSGRTSCKGPGGVRRTDLVGSRVERGDPIIIV